MEQNIILRNNVKISGKGTKPILFAAGFGCDQTVWRDITNAFEEDFKVVLFDYVGSGHSDISQYDPDRYATLEGYAQDVLDLCESLDLRDTVFVGHSVGSMIGMIASLKNPEYFSDLVMIGPSPCYLNFPPEYLGGFEREQLIGLLDMLDKNFIGWANYFSGVVTNNPERPDIKEEMEERFCSTDPVIAKQFAEATFFSDYREELKRVSVPTLIMQCSEDIIAPAGVGQYMQENIKNSVLVQMEAEGHCPHLCSPEETITIIRNYLKLETSFEDAQRRGFLIDR